MDLKELGAWLFQPGIRDIHRIETLDGYVSTGDEPHYTRWRQGLPVEVNEAWDAWLTKIAHDADNGVTRRRVHVMTEPLTPHNLFECGEQYTRNGAAGEQIRAMTADPTVRARMQDFWVLDHQQVAVMEYDEAGRFQSAWTPQDPQPWVSLGWALWTAAEPFDSWWAARPQYHGQRQVA